MRRITLFTVLQLFLVACGVSAQRDDRFSSRTEEPAEVGREATLSTERDDRFSSRTEDLAGIQRQAILKEARLVQEPHWAGEYYYGDGLGVNVSLTLAPGSGFVFEWHGCLGLYDRNLGTVETVGDRIVLKPEFVNNRKGFQGIATEFYWIRWGERSYLVATDKVQDFCNSINGGFEPRDGEHGRFLLKEGDRSKAASGKPLFPRGIRDCVLDKPIGGQILAVSKGRLRPSCCGFNFRDTEATISVGRALGVTLGMEFFTSSDARLESAKVVDLLDETATVLFAQFEGDPSPQVGWRMSTRRRNRGWN